MKSSSFEMNNLTQHISSTRAPYLAIIVNHPEKKKQIYKIETTMWQFILVLYTDINIYTTPTDAIAFTNAHFGAGTGTIYLDNVGCTGSENNLIDCPRSSIVSCTSGHTEDAGVRCQSWFCL